MTQTPPCPQTAPPEQREYVQQKRNEREEKHRRADRCGVPATADTEQPDSEGPNSHRMQLAAKRHAAR
jgi:hypothetical protein